MPKLTVTNLTPAGTTPAYQLADVLIQDPFPAEGKLVLQVPAGATKSVNVEMGQLQRVRPQLVDLQQKGLVSWSSEATDLDPRGEEADLMGAATIDALDTGTTAITHAAANVGCQAMGTNLLMGMLQSIRRLSDPAAPAARYCDILAIDPGIAGDRIGVVLINDAAVVDPSNIEYAEVAAPLPDGYDRILEIHVLPATFTWPTLAAILNDVVNGIYARTVALPAGPFRLQSGANAGPALTPPVDQALGALAGGEGVPLMLTVGDTAGVITLLTDTLMRYDVDLTASPLAAGDSVMLKLRSSGGGPSALAGTGLA
jgi:hypothetical protein